MDVKISGKGVYAYSNETDETMNLLSETYNFTSATLLVFNKDGLLIEAGANLQAKDGFSTALVIGCAAAAVALAVVVAIIGIKKV